MAARKVSGLPYVLSSLVFVQPGADIGDLLMLVTVALLRDDFEPGGLPMMRY